MTDATDRDLRDIGLPESYQGARHASMAGAPLPMGASGYGPETAQHKPLVPPLGRSMPSSAGDAAPDHQDSPGLQWAVSALLRAFPFVQRLMPLLEGTGPTSLTNIESQPPATTTPRIDLVPIEDGLAQLATQQSELRNHIAEQNNTLKRVEDQLEMVREATDRNTLEQQELLEDLKGMGNKVNLFAYTALGLLAISIVLNIMLMLHLNRVLP
jgi:hypothetical protein